ncbi:hypothetical protein MLD38_009756 [Melastoma candidum]|uniref:Uncharacterized protein n=1 Tax=Melastoma candidum TaxID=119954 RepID=A0ACB9RYR6_9MYRT|nr:hypothetical protein MLD38_009756 [Melastoma candidum]
MLCWGTSEYESLKVIPINANPPLQLYVGERSYVTPSTPNEHMLVMILDVDDDYGGDDPRVGVGSSGGPLLSIGSYHYPQPLLDARCHNHRAPLPLSRFVQVPHVNQLSSWDCGLACLVMVMRTLGIETCSVESLASLCCTTSIWTVDLAYLLHKFSINFSYCTVTLGANPNYSDETFYKEQLPTDVLRVNKLFRDAPSAGICIQCRSITEEQISCLILSGGYVAIALVDQYKLSHNWLEEDVYLSYQSDSSEYTGHYIVICGYDASRDEFEIKDPASTRKQEKISSKCLGDARRSFGTDEDILLICLRKQRKD